MNRPAVTPLTAKGGMIIHYCTVCDEAYAGHGLGPPAVPKEVWFCDLHTAAHLQQGRADPGRLAVAA